LKVLEYEINWQENNDFIVFQLRDEAELGLSSSVLVGTS
jgi:hypothetical protein